MNTIPAQEIKRRGIAAVDDCIANGDLHVIRNNQPQYVVLSEARYQALLEAEDEAHGAGAGLAGRPARRSGATPHSGGAAERAGHGRLILVHPRLDLRLHPRGREVSQAAPGIAGKVRGNSQ